MKIAIVTPYFYPKLGGLENYALKICNELKTRYKCQVFVITSNHKAKKYKVEIVNGIKIYRLPYMLKISNTPINPMWYFSIKKILKQEQPDIINAHTPVPGISDIAALVAGKTPLLVTYHAFSLHKYNAPIFNIIISIYKTMENNLFKKATKILVVSDAIKTTLPQKFKNKIITINNSLTYKEIPNQKEKSKGSSTNIKKVVFIGNLDKTHEWKGLKEILAAVKIYNHKSDKKIQLNIIGEGDNKNHYKKITNDYGINKQVNFLGKKEGKEKVKILRSSDIGILYPKSSNDAFPTVVLEYWAYSIAVLASDILPVNTIIKNRKTGYLIEPQNPHKLAAGIKYIVNNNTIAKKIVQNGYKELTGKYILENEVKKFYSLAKSLTI
jgi:rhamnosyl/mannosyltransferase